MGQNKRSDLHLVQELDLNAYRTYGYMVDDVNPGLNEHKPDLAWAKEYAKRVKTDNTGFKNDTERQLYNKIKVVISR